MVSITKLLLLSALLNIGHANDDDWQVRRDPVKDQARIHQRLYGHIDTQEEWEIGFKRAFKKGDASAVRYLIQLSANKKDKITFDINAKDENGETLLHKAAGFNSGAMTSTLLKAGADPNATDAKGNTPLHRAVSAEKVGPAKALLKNPNTNINAENQNKERPFATALLSRNLTMIAFLKRYKPDMNFRLQGELLSDWIVKTDYVDLFKIFYPKIDPKKLPANERGTTVLHQAATFDSDDIAKYLLDKGADPQIEIEGKVPAFAIALTNGSTKVFSLFLKDSPDIINYRDHKTGDTLLHVAFDTGQTEIADILLANNPPLLSKNNNGKTPRDIVNAYKSTLPAESPEKAKYDNYAVEIEKQEVADKKAFDLAIASNDLKKFRKIIKRFSIIEIEELLVSLAIDGRKKLIDELLKSHGNEMNNARLFSNQKLYASKSWSGFKYLYERLGGFGPASSKQTTTLALTADADFIKKTFDLNPPVEYNVAATEVDGLILDAVNHAIRKNPSEKARLTAVKTVLKENDTVGIKTVEEINERLEALLPAGRGKEIFERYSPELLSKLNPIVPLGASPLGLAFLYDDFEVANELLKHTDNATVLRRGEYALASAKMRKHLESRGIRLPKKGPCLALGHDLHASKVYRQQLTKWVKRDGGVYCADEDHEEAIAAVDFARNMAGNHELFEAVMNTAGVKAAIKRSPALMARPITSIIMECDPHALKYIENTGYDANLKLPNGTTPLMSVIEEKRCSDSNRASMVRSFVAAGADVNAVNEEGETPLFLAAIDSYNEAIIHELIRAGAKFYVPEKCYGSTSPQVERFTGSLDYILDEEQKLRRQADQKEDCQSVAQKAEAEYRQALVAAAQSIDQWQKALLHASKALQKSSPLKNDNKQIPNLLMDAMDAAGIHTDMVEKLESGWTAVRAMCCQPSFRTSRCEQEIMCQEFEPERKMRAPLCSRLSEQNDGNLATTLKLNESSSEYELALRLKFDFAPRPSFKDTDIGLSLKVPRATDASFDMAKAEEIIDSQIEAIYKKLNLSSLKDYVTWRYPQCASQYKDDKLSWDSVFKEKSVNKRTASPAKTSGSSKGENAH